MIPDDLVTPKQAARLLRTHPSTVYRLISTGRLPAIQIGTARYHIREADLRGLLTPVRPRRVDRIPGSNV